MTRYAWMWQGVERGVTVGGAGDRSAKAWLLRRGHGALLQHVPTTHRTLRAHWRELAARGVITMRRARQIVEAAEAASLIGQGEQEKGL